MTTPDALTVLRYAAYMFAERATYSGAEVRSRLDDLRARLEREQAEARRCSECRYPIDAGDIYGGHDRECSQRPEPNDD